jgi:hypothetical protein
MRVPPCLLAAALLTASAGPALARQDADHLARTGAWRLGVWVGASPDSPTASLIGGVPGRELYAAGVRLARVMHAGRAIQVDLVVTALPAVVVSDNPIGIYETVPGPSGEPMEVLVDYRVGSVYGAGFAPLGVHLYLPGQGPVRLRLGSAVGAVAFVHPIPAGAGGRLHWTVEAGAALALGFGRFELSGGYRLLHLSHFSGFYNPGLNAHLFHVGVARLL